MTRNLKGLLLLAVLLSLHLIAFSGTITVTSNADSGPGTLRDAITTAAANGTATQDSIVFALTDNSIPGRTITLLSPLPALTSNMVINGASQSGTAIGVSQAKILLYLPAISGNFDFLEAFDCTDVGIYGLAMVSMVNNPNYQKVNGISYVRCHNLQIGRPGAGNYMFGCVNSINSNTASYGYYVDADTSRGLTIQSNIIGLDLNGGFSNLYNGVQVSMMFYSLHIINTSDIIIGGDDPAQGNTIVYGYTDAGYSISGINLYIETYRDVGDGVLTIKNNKLGTRTDGTLDPNNALFPVFLHVLCNFNADYTFQFVNNYLKGQLWIYEFGKYFTIQGNTIFSTKPNTIYDLPITVMSCPGGGIIGGDDPSQSNTIYNAYTDTIYYFEDNQWEGSIRFDLLSHVTIKNNVTTCNSYHSSSITNDNIGSAYNTAAWVRIDSTGVNFVKGKAIPNTRVDVYLDDDCDACEGKQYLGFTMANADSTWQFTGTFNSVIVATSTALSNGQTSEFSQPEIINWWTKVTQPSCGLANGSVTGLQVTGGDNVKWHYLYKKNGVWVDSIYSRSVDLVNAKAGTYFFDAWLGNTCRSAYVRFDLYDVEHQLDSTYKTLTNPSCGGFNGSITGLALNNYQNEKLLWRDSAGAIVSTGLDLLNAGPGIYKLVFQDTVGGCIDSTGWYRLVNQSGPTVDINTAQITPAQCKNADGSISKIQYSNITGTATYTWVDSNNRIVGNSPDLLNVPAGKYALKFKDAGACDTIVTPFFEVGSTGAILFDTTAMAIQPSKCTGPSGAILNIVAPNATSYQWIDSLTGNVISSQSDLQGVAPGYYRLIAESQQGCKDSTRELYVPPVAVTRLLVSAFTAKQETCGRGNAYVVIDSLYPTAVGYSYYWTDSIGQQVVSNTENLENVHAGKYYFYATDDNGCKQLVDSALLIGYPAPVLHQNAVDIQPDVCALQQGAITGLTVSGASSGVSYSWYIAGGQPAGNSIDLTNAGAGDYYLVVNDPVSCADTSQLFAIRDTTELLSPPQYAPIYVLRGKTAVLTLDNPEQGTYRLFASDTSAVAVGQNTTGSFTTGLIEGDTTVYVEYTKGICSSDKAPVTIQVLLTLSLIVPNAFTPNGDGHNDVFRIENPGLVKTFGMTVYNRWGQKVFETQDPYQGWDGYINGTPQPAGTYVWNIQYTDIVGNKANRVGTMMLIR